VPQQVQRRAVEQRVQGLRLGLRVARGVQAAGAVELGDPGGARTAHGQVQRHHLGVQGVVGQGERPELHLRAELDPPLLVQRQQLGQHRLHPRDPLTGQPPDPSRRPLGDRLEAEPPQRVLRREGAAQRGGGEPGLLGDLAHGQAGQPVAAEHPQRSGGDLLVAGVVVDQSGHGLIVPQRRGPFGARSSRTPPTAGRSSAPA
jgi:hypothetical protein